MPEYTIPEIQRTSLTSVILTLKCLGVHDVIRYTVCFVSLILGRLRLINYSVRNVDLFQVSLSGLSRGKVYS